VLLAIYLAACCSNVVVGSKQNMLCITWYCGGNLRVCLSEEACRDGLLCLRDCGRDQECTFGCLYRYGTPTYQTFLKCVIPEHDCVTLEAEETPVRCSVPAVGSVSDAARLPSGEWRVMAATNAYHDAQACHRLNITSNKVQRSFRYMDKHLSQPKSIQDSRENLQADSTNGVVRTHGQRLGLKLNEEWRVLSEASDKTWAIIYRCGHFGAWEYDGQLLIVKKSVSNNMKVPEAARRIMDESKLKWSQVDHKKC